MNELKKGLGKDGNRPSGKITPRSPKDALQPKDAPKPPKRAKQARNGAVVAMNFMFTSLVILALMACGAFFFGKNVFEQPGPLKEQKTIQIKDGEALGDIATKLENRGIVSNSLVFTLGVRAYQAASSLKTGEYSFSPNMSMRDVMDTIRSGKGILYKLSFPEGWTNHQIFERISQSDLLTGPMPEMPAEGELMPDTYPFVRGTTRMQIVERMKAAKQKYVQQIWDKRVDGLPLNSPEEMLILASIVEKETGKADERPRVAAVFINRLRKGMKLQSDPTIIYGIYGGKGKPSDQPIMKADISKPTPYNTYVIDALPPAPIGNPGRASLEAVANPSITDEYYFVADGTGGHVFAKTLPEHEANVLRWRNIEKRLKIERQKLRPSTQAEDSAQN